MCLVIDQSLACFGDGVSISEHHQDQELESTAARRVTAIALERAFGQRHLKAEGFVLKGVISLGLP